MATKRERSKCFYCRFGQWIQLSVGAKWQTVCVYILMTGKRRPCPYGEACSVYQPRKRRKGGGQA